MTMKKILIVLFGLGLPLIFAGCEGDTDEEDGGGKAKLTYDHVFLNGTVTPGDLVIDGDSLGPKIESVSYNMGARSVVIQGEHVTLAINYSDLDQDVSTSSALLIQIMGQPEYWTFDNSQFGIGTETMAVVRVELSPRFQPDTYILKIGLRDDAGHVQNLFYRLMIVLPYQTPEILEVYPADGQTAVPLNASVFASFSAAVVGDPPTVSLTRNGQSVPGQSHMIPNRKRVIFKPTNFLLPNTDYQLTVSVGDLLSGGVKTKTVNFRTGSWEQSVNVAGRVYSIEFTLASIWEPPGAELFVGDIPPLLFKMLTFNDTQRTITSIAAISEGDDPPLLPDLSVPNFLLSGEGVLQNPFFRIGPSTIMVDVGSLAGGDIMAEVHLYDLTLTGRFSPDGQTIEYGIITAYIDSAEINQVLGPLIPGNIPFNICLALPDADCDEEGHLGLHAEGLIGYYQPHIDYFYDLSVEAQPSTIGTTGGTITISGNYMVDGQPTGSQNVGLKTTHGTFPGGGNTYSLVTTNGSYSVTLTVPPGLPAGTLITVTAETTSPQGKIERTKKIRVQ